MSEQTSPAPSTAPIREEWLSPKDICRELQIPEQTFYQWRTKHAGPRAHRIGRHLRISRTDLNEWLATTEDHLA
ncbi:excisionase family DNA binding protein [Arthrobacter stackebrandtii]|uniref:Excisionase family DNA binding protein n=1 Tax=Arthrobacter stackebrandtii TaxID=272161 RepID=A0ABS4YZN8_9MICC|nr:helix-turn-helix domain-containing protein [Arthrobacter stackebrandtii]MBP2414256.1 excisionase family DNA binding protein [Arthrobacter stackebrandtii]PYG98656.1 DNA-binding protein [Arthrobacter stackebrandtii]